MGWLIASFLIAFGVGVIVLFTALERRAKGQRTAAMRGACQLMGFTFTEALSKDQRTALEHLAVFNQGHSREARNQMAGKIGSQEVHLLDYRYVVGGGKHQRRHDQTLILLPGGGQGMPEFHLSPEGFWDKVAQMFGQQDIDFDQAPEFSKAYRLRGGNPETLRAFFTAEKLEFFSHEKGWSVQSSGGDLAVYRQDVRCDADKCPEHLAQAMKVWEALLGTEAC